MKETVKTTSLKYILSDPVRNSLPLSLQQQKCIPGLRYMLMAVWQWLPFTVTPKRTALPKKVSVIKTKKNGKHTLLLTLQPQSVIYILRLLSSAGSCTKDVWFQRRGTKSLIGVPHKSSPHTHFPKFMATYEELIFSNLF